MNVKNLSVAATGMFLAGVIALSGCGGETKDDAQAKKDQDNAQKQKSRGDDQPSGQSKKSKDIVATAASAGSFNTLLAAAKAAGLAETLQGEGPYTVFAPTDDAFAKLPPGTVDNLLKPENKDQLAAILTYHVVPGKVMSDEAAKLDSANTVNGQELAIQSSSDGLTVGQAKVVKADIACSNGVIHVIDSVILPKTTTQETVSDSGKEKQQDIVATAANAGSFETLLAAVKAAGLAETLQGEGPFTVFAPTDEAFAKLPAGTVENLLKPENKDQLIAILTYHVVPQRVMSSEAVKLDTAKTVNGQQLPLAASDAGLSVANAKVVKADIDCSNGVIHVVDTVILPNSEGSSTAAKPSSDQKDIVGTAVAAGSFNTLVAAVKAADLVDVLQQKGPYTVFAPTDEAFKKLPEGTLESLLKPENREKLQSILTYHVVPGKVMAADVMKRDEAKTVNGQSLQFSQPDSKTVKVNGATVLKTDIQCSNGVIHVVDSVILPKE